VKALLKFSFGEALSGLRRGWRTSAVALVTTVAAVFVAATAVLVSTNVTGIIQRLGAAAELTVFLDARATPEQRARVDAILARSPIVLSRTFISPDEAMRRFAADVPDLASLTQSLGENALPPSFEVQLRPGDEHEQAARDLTGVLSATGVVSDVRYDREVIGRLLTGLTLMQSAGAVLASVLAIAALLTISSVLRLSYQTRRDEIAIMYLVGAPPRAIRGPIVMEGVLQAAGGAILALVGLAAAFAWFTQRYGHIVADAFGLSAVTFLPWTVLLLIVLLSAFIGGLAGLGASWRER